MLAIAPLVACSSEPVVDAASASGGSTPSCCVEGVHKTGDACGPDARGICRGAPLECYEWCMEDASCAPRRVEGPECRSSCPGEPCPAQ
ncbi:MAG TPA: hypothetical protein VM686_28415 [Polyangiaceae bacterium]|nr:hypothetical protein [Polyangiaceae bacterium]